MPQEEVDPFAGSYDMRIGLKRSGFFREAGLSDVPMSEVARVERGTELAAVCAREAADPQPAADDAAHTDLATAAVGRLLAGGGQGVVGVLEWLDGR